MGRTLCSRAQRCAGVPQDARDAVVAARKAFASWSAATAYSRGQVLYRLAETMERRVASSRRCAVGGARSRKPSIASSGTPAGRTSSRVLGGANPVAGPCFNFTVPEPTGVVAVVAPAEPARQSRADRSALVGRNAVVVVASEAHPLAAIELAEAIATSDVPAGAVNVLTGLRAELAPVLAARMDVNAIDVTGADGDVAALEVLAAENVKRVVRAREDRSPWEIGAFMELKTVWHPIGR